MMTDDELDFAQRVVLKLIADMDPADALFVIAILRPTIRWSRPT